MQEITREAYVASSDQVFQVGLLSSLREIPYLVDRSFFYH